MPKKPAPQKLWTLRMPNKLLVRLKGGADEYGIPTSTYARLMMEMGLYYEKVHGLQVMGDAEDIAAAEAFNRKAVAKAIKERDNPPKPRGRPRKVRTTEESPEPLAEEETEEETTPGQEHQVSAHLSGDSRTRQQATVPQPGKVVDFLTDAGVSPLSEPAQESEEDDLNALLATL